MWLEGFDFPITNKDAVEQGFLFHGMGDASFKELLQSQGFEGGGFASKPVKSYGPNFIAIRKQDMPKPVWNQGQWNIQYSFKKPFRDFVPVRSDKDVKYYGNQLYAIPLKYIYLADEEGNVLRPLKH